MLVAFAESIKYIGHMVPVAFLRIFLGYFYINRALHLFKGEFLTHPHLAEDIRAYLPTSEAPDWYKGFLEYTVVPNWQPFAYFMVISFAAVGLSYIIGYLVRPLSLLGIGVALGLAGSLGTSAAPSLSVFLIVMHLTLGWVGAGRCLGLDYYFYKRHRGIWW